MSRSRVSFEMTWMVSDNVINGANTNIKMFSSGFLSGFSCECDCAKEKKNTDYNTYYDYDE